MKILKEKLVEEFIRKRPKLWRCLKNLEKERKEILLALIKIGEKEVFEKDFLKISKDLVAVHRFYKEMGGFLGYYQKVCSLMFKEEKEDIKILPPPFFDISKKTKQVDKYIVQAIKAMPFFCEIYPIGGSGDRLNWKKDDRPQPTASLPFLGKSLLQILVQDLMVRERLYYDMYKKRIETPIVLMTSEDKNNHENILKILEKNNWFGRKKNNFFIFKQFLSPLITEDKRMVLNGHFLFKPSGHGVLWKLMKEKKVFDWLYKKNRTKALIRQVNNPIAGMDYGILAFLGCGIFHKKKFGIACCARKEGAEEGMNVLKKKGDFYTISNIEYTDFKKHRIKKYSTFPSNTNILFADLKSVEKALKKNPYPGAMVNMKIKVGEKKVCRLELMMQNITDSLYAKDLSVYVTLNDREKTISTTKYAYKKGEKIFSTPVSCYFDFLKNYQKLLQKYCFFKTPEIENMENPGTYIYITPFLGPSFFDIAKKICFGKIEKGSYFYIDADVFIKNLFLCGSLKIIKKDFLRRGECILENVQIINKGIDKKRKNIFWKDCVYFRESLFIVLEKNASFEAKNVVFKRNFIIKVPENCKVIAFMDKGKVRFKKLKQ